MKLAALGFTHVPTVPPEDLILAKLFALQGTPGRVTDIDDVSSIWRHNPNLDKEYLSERLERYAIRIPDSLTTIVRLD